MILTKNRLESTMKLSQLCLFLGMISLLFGCQGSIASQIIANSYPTAPRNYLSAGFEKSEDVGAYAKQYQYLAFKMTEDDWRGFYVRFPEYWKDMQSSKSYTFMNDYNSGYTAYAFRWNMLNKKKKWDDGTVNRLIAKNVLKGDNIYQVVFSLGIPERILWDNDFDILIYGNDIAISIDNVVVNKIYACKGCCKKMSLTDKQNRNLDINADIFVISEDEVLRILNLSRPEY